MTQQLSIAKVVASFNLTELWAEDVEELMLLSQKKEWCEVKDWGQYTMLFLNAKQNVFKTICLAYIEYSLSTKQSNESAAETILRKLLEEPEVFKNFDRNELLQVKLWMDSVFFQYSKFNGAYEKWQYDENIDVLLLLAIDP